MGKLVCFVKWCYCLLFSIYYYWRGHEFHLWLLCSILTHMDTMGLHSSKHIGVTQHLSLIRLEDPSSRITSIYFRLYPTFSKKIIIYFCLFTKMHKIKAVQTFEVAFNFYFFLQSCSLSLKMATKVSQSSIVLCLFFSPSHSLIYLGLVCYFLTCFGFLYVTSVIMPPSALDRLG